MLSVAGPSGRFGLDPEPGATRRVVLVGAGSGVTPLVGIARALARAEPDSRVLLLLGNRRASDILYRQELERLANLEVVHSLTRPGTRWKGARGRLEGAHLAALLPIDPGAHYLVCGPAGLMESVQTLLSEGGGEG